jgi:signal transduction histidine kinase
MAAPRLPSIRNRIVITFVLFGFAVCALVLVTFMISGSWQTAVFSLLLILLLLITSGWHIGNYVTRDLRRLTNAFQHLDTAAVMKKGAPDWLGHEASSTETRAFAQAFERFVQAHQDDLRQCVEQMSSVERQREDASLTLRNFMYQVAHTLRTPLNAIRWNIEMLKNEEVGELSESERELLDKTEYSALRLLHLADELQDTLVVLRGERLHMRSQPNDLVSIIDEVAGVVAVPARRSSVSLVWKHPTGKLPSILCDRARIEQVLHILLDNAIRYSKVGGKVTVTTHLLTLDTPENVLQSLHLTNVPSTSIVVAVRDTGMGIPAKEQEHAFQPFFRGEAAKELWVDGKGIALTIARAIVTQCGGSIWFHSQPKRGSTFYFSLPAVF